MLQVNDKLLSILVETNYGKNTSAVGLTEGRGEFRELGDELLADTPIQAKQRNVE